MKSLSMVWWAVALVVFLQSQYLFYTTYTGQHDNNGNAPHRREQRPEIQNAPPRRMSTPVAAVSMAGVPEHAPCPTCPACEKIKNVPEGGACFPEDLSGIQCIGLLRDRAGDSSSKQCQDNCCADWRCTVWQWKAAVGTFDGCWRGRPSDTCHKVNPGWVGGRRAPLLERPGPCGNTCGDDQACCRLGWAADLYPCAGSLLNASGMALGCASDFCWVFCVFFSSFHSI